MHHVIVSWTRRLEISRYLDIYCGSGEHCPDLGCWQLWIATLIRTLAGDEMGHSSLRGVSLSHLHCGIGYGYVFKQTCHSQVENYWSEEKKFIGQVRCPKFQFIAQFIFTFSQTRENFRLSLAVFLSARRNTRCFKELNIKFREGSFPALISTNAALLHSCMCCCDVVLW